jgi:hypothetical protein
MGLFLAEYYLSTGDPNVVAGINSYTVTLAQSQSMYGTFGHGPSKVRPDGTLRRSVAGYGPVNQCGIPANIAIVMGKTALVAAAQVIDPEIDPANTYPARRTTAPTARTQSAPCSSACRTTASRKPNTSPA